MPNTHVEFTVGSPVAVVGAGQMGRGIAQVVAASGHPVLLFDVAAAVAVAAKETIGKSLDRQVQKGKLTGEARAALLTRITPVAEVAQLAKVGLAIEAASERETIKRDIFSKLDAVLPPAALLATNTSSISITRLAAATGRPGQVIGMHFMNPVPVMTLVEVICGVATTAATRAQIEAFAGRLGKQVVVAQDYPGFIVNRILMPMINEAAFALMEGVASAAHIDTAMTLGTNQPMGPLTLADFIGLDTCLAILEVMHQDLGDPKYRPCPLLRRLVESNRLGRKTGHGFHTY